MTLAEQFAAAPQIIMTQPERIFEDPNFVSTMNYPGFEHEPKEIGFILHGGKITRRIFVP